MRAGDEACLRLEAVVRALRRVTRDLAAALDRIPPGVTAKPLVEGALRLSQGALNSSLGLASLLKCGLEGELVDLDVAEPADS